MEKIITNYCDFEYPVNIALKFSKTSIIFADTRTENDILASINIEDLTDIIPVDDVKFKVCLLFSSSRQVVIPCTNEELRNELINRIFKFKNFIDYFYNKQIVVKSNIDDEDWPVTLTLREITGIEVDMLTYSIKFYNLIGGYSGLKPTVEENANIWFDDVTDNVNPLKLSVYSKIRNISYNEQDYEEVIKYMNEINSPYIKVL